MIKNKIGWKVPFRRVYANSFKSMIKTTIWCHLVIRLWPCVYDFGSDPFLKRYLKEPEFITNQLGFLIKRGIKQQKEYEKIHTKV